MKRGLWLAVAVLAPRLVLFFLNENLAGDAIARVWLAHRWLAEPHLMTSFGSGAKQFGPLHLYLLALAEWAWPSLLHAGRVVSLLAGVLTAWPLHSLTARRFGASAATYAVLGFAFWGLHLQCSTTSASEALNLLLVLGAVALFDVAPERRAAWWGAVLLLNLACATRYDSWLLVPLLAAAEWWRTRSLVKAIGLGAAASAFAIAWLLGNWRDQGDPFFPIRFIDQYHREWWPREARVWGEWTYRVICLFFWPGAAALMLTPLYAVAGGLMLRKAWAERPELRWLVALILVPTVLYTFRSAVTASFAPLARFTMKEVLLLLPFAGWGLQRLAERRPNLARGAVVLAAAWCFALGAFCFRPDTLWSFSFRSIAATSRVESPIRELASWLRENAAPAPGLLVVDEDPNGFDDLPISYFSGLGFDDQLRRRYANYEQVLATAIPKWLVLFPTGRMLRDREVRELDAEHVVFLGRRFQLRHLAAARVYERLD